MEETKPVALFEHLPLLSLDHAFAIFTKCGLAPTKISALTGLSRQTIFKYRNGTKPNPLARERVSLLAYRCLLQYRDTKKPFPLKASLDAIRAELATRQLESCDAETIIPKPWHSLYLAKAE